MIHSTMQCSYFCFLCPFFFFPILVFHLKPFIVYDYNLVPKSKSAYFLPFECFAGSETCFFCFLSWSFSLCSFLCCSKPAAFFSLLDKNSSTLAGNRSITHSKTLSYCLQMKGVYSIPILSIYLPYYGIGYFLPT